MTRGGGGACDRQEGQYATDSIAYTLGGFLVTEKKNKQQGMGWRGLCSEKLNQKGGGYKKDG